MRNKSIWAGPMGASERESKTITGRQAKIAHHDKCQVVKYCPDCKSSSTLSIPPLLFSARIAQRATTARKKSQVLASALMPAQQSLSELICVDVLPKG